MPFPLLNRPLKGTRMNISAAASQQSAPVREAAPVAAVSKAAPAAASGSAQSADTVKISAKAQEAFEASQKGGGDADHDGD